MNPDVRPYHHGDLRNELIRVGLELISEGGTEAVGLRESARRIGVSASAAYRHFENRADLVDAVHDRVLHNVAAELHTALEGHEDEPVENRLEIVGRAYFKFAIENPLQFEALATAFPLAQDWATSSERPLRIVIQIVSEIQPASDSAGQDALSVWAIVHGAASLATIGSLRDIAIEKKWELLERTLEILLKGLGLRQ